MSFTYWTYRRPFTIKDQVFEVKVGTRIRDWHTRLLQDGRELARDGTDYMGAQADYRNHRVRHTLPDGSVLEVESGWVNWVTVDIALGLLFFLVAKATGNLNTAALVGVAAGLAVVVAQRFVKVELLGGLALFGVLTLLLSAGFSLWFQDEHMVQLKGTILGGLIASIILLDASFNQGRYFGARIARYVPGAAVDARRLAMGTALLGLTMAGLNLAVTTWMSKDLWLTYTTFIDAPLGVVLAMLVFKHARR